MKKLFFFRSNSSSSANNNHNSPPSTDKQVYWERPPEKGKSTKNKHGSEDQTYCATPRLRRSLSFSSGSFYDSGKGLPTNGDLMGSPCSANNKHSGHQSSRFRTLTPERQSRKKIADPRVEKLDYIVSREYSDLSEISSYCSSNVSNKVLDRYIDGEQQEDRHVPKANSSRSNQSENGNAVVMQRPPRFHLGTAPSHVARKQKPKSQSFRETKVSQPQFTSINGGNSEYCPESPRKLAKHVVERLSQSRFLPKLRSKELSHDNPITIEDVYEGSLNRNSDAYNDDMSQKNWTPDWHTEPSDGSYQEEISEFMETGPFGNKDRHGESIDALLDTDLELFKKFKEAEDRAAVLSEELGKGSFNHEYRGLGMPALIQAIRTLTEEKLGMALEVSAVLRDRIAEKAYSREKLKLEREELDGQIRRFEKERKELQASLEIELDRRSNEWLIKLEKCQAEEQRLRDRVRELAEQNVCLQREISSFSEKEEDTKSKIMNLEKQLADILVQAREANEENHYLQKTLSEMEERASSAEEDRDCIRRNYDEKAAECTDLHQVVSRLQRISTDQEKTIDGLRLLCEELGKKKFEEDPDFELKLQVEHKRLTGVEHALRKEVESCRAQVDSLRRENIYLLDRLKNHGKDGAFSTFKLDQELEDRISFLQNQMLPSLIESSLIGRRLLEYVKTGNGHEFLIECEVKLQGVERAAENLKVSVQTMSDVLREKCYILREKSCSLDESDKVSEHKSEDIIKSELKAETLLTSLLREKLYSKEQDVEQLQSELSAAIRGNDILKCEAQNAVDNYSCLNHKMQDLELKMMKKDETINQLQCDLQECKKELTIVRGILPKVSDERDMMWEKVKHYTEKNMLLDVEITNLKKKIESLDEDILVKEGQIAILRDSIGKPFDLLAGTEVNVGNEIFSWTATTIS